MSEWESVFAELNRTTVYRVGAAERNCVLLHYIKSNSQCVRTTRRDKENTGFDNPEHSLSIHEPIRDARCIKCTKDAYISGFREMSKSNELARK